MLTTGINEIDNLFKKSASVQSSHKVLAEWNQNSYTGVSYIGSYPIKLTGTSSDPDYSETFNASQSLGGWDNGGYFYEYDSDAGTGVRENKEREALSPIRDIVKTERPDPGIIHQVQYKNLNSTSISTVRLAEDATDLRAYQLFNTKNRVYPCHKDSATKYWSSPRQRKPNATSGIALDSAYVGVSDEDGEMLGNNAFVVYDTDIITNKIVVKTQTINGYPEDFKVQVLKSSSPAAWATIFTEDSTARSARAITSITATGLIGSNTVTLSSLNDIYVGMFISGTGIPAGSKIESILPASAVEISSNLTANITASATSIVDKPLEDGILRLTGKAVSGVITWSISGGVESENSIETLLIGQVTGAEQIKGIRFISTKLSRENGSLDIIEISPRIVIDLSSYVTDISINSTMGDFQFGIPSGSMVSSEGTITLFNQDNVISNRNVDSILNGRIKPNVKFTILNKIISENYQKYVPVKVLYADTWEQGNDWTVSVKAKDYTKFWDDQSAPDILLGASEGLRSSSIIKILLDNAGFTRFNFVKTSDLQEYDYEDRKMDFFYCDKTISVSTVLQNIAQSMQLSMFFDQFGIFTVMTKEAAVQKQDYFNYWLVGDYENLLAGDQEFSQLNNNYKSNIESFDDSIIQPITAGEVQYQNLGIPKVSTYLLNKALDKDFSTDLAAIGKDDVGTILDSGYSQLTLNRNMSFVPQKMWSPDEAGAEEGILAAGILVEDISNSSYRAKTVLGAQEFTAKNKNDAIRKAYQHIEAQGNLHTLGSSIFITEDSLTVAFSQKFSGYVFIDSELIKYNGILFIVSRPGQPSGKKIYFSFEELKADKDNSPSGSNFIPNALIVDIDMKIKSSPTLSSNTFKYVCSGDGRGQDGSEVNGHFSALTSSQNNWNYFKTKMYDTPANQPTGSQNATLNFIVDTGIPISDRVGEQETIRIPSGFAKLVGPASPTNPNTVSITATGTISTNAITLSSTTGVAVGMSVSGIGIASDATISAINGLVATLSVANVGTVSGVMTFGESYPIDQINIYKKGQLQISGATKDCGFHPKRVGTRMTIKRKNNQNKETLSTIGGICFNVSQSAGGGYTGYFLEASTISTTDDFIIEQPSNHALKLYKVTLVDGKLVPTRLGSSVVGITWNESLTDMIPANYTGNTEDTYISCYSLEVYMSGNNISVFFEGKQVMTVTDSSPVPGTNNVGVFVRDDSNAVYDFIYANTVPDDREVSITSPDFLPSPRLSLGDTDTYDGQLARRFFSTYLRQRLVSGYNVFYEDFGNLVREAKKYEVRFNQPSFDSILIELSKVNPSFYVKDFKASSFGATFWIFNTSSDMIRIDGGSDFPVYITGIGLSKLSESKIDISNILENQTEEEKVNSTLEINRRLYGETSINISGEYITSRSYAENLAEWIANNASKEKIEINATIFPNPLLQLGDKIKVFYKDSGYCQSQQTDDKLYVLSSIGYSVNESGTSMSVKLQEMI